MIKIILKSKKATDLLSATTIGIILTVLFFSFLFLFLGNSLSGDSFYETIYSKELALAIDSLKEGTEITFSLDKLYAIAEKNNFYEDVVDVNSETHNVTIKVNRGDGKTYQFFNEIKAISRDNNLKTLTIKA
jgi:hypothetical protein